MNKRNKPLYLGMLAGLTLIGLGISYENLWCDPRAEIAAVGATTDLDSAHRLSRDGVTVEFEARPLGSAGALSEGGFASIRFKVTEQNTGQPLSGVSPGAWIDPARVGEAASERDKSCKARVGLFLKSSIGARPLLDLNSYFLLVLNKDASLTVIDPSVSVGGVTSTLARIDLPQPPMDWVASADDKHVFVTLPAADQVALVNTETFQMAGLLSAGKQPVRIAMQPDQRLLWVGNNATDATQSGVTVIDGQTHRTLKFIATGAGHHEIAFSQDSRYAFVSNRDSGTVSVIDSSDLSLVKSLKVGPHPLSVAYSALSQAIYVADGRDGGISVIDVANHRLRSRIQAKQGLGPMSFSRDGRFGIVLNTLENRAVIIDASTDKAIHELEVSAEPYQLTFTKAYAYIRGLASPKVTMINLATLGEGRQPITQGFDAGPAAPRQAGDLPLARSLSVARDENSVFVVNPVDNTTYFYAEGMNAPMSGYLNRGHNARAALVIDRSLREVAPGVYSSTVKLPAAGKFDVAFLLNQPQIIHCFSTEVQASANGPRQHIPRVEFLLERPQVVQGNPFVARFRIVEGDGTPRNGIKDLTLRYFLAPSSRAKDSPVREVGEGVYEAPLELAEAGAWYLHVQAPSLGKGFAEKNYTSVRVLPANAQ